MQYANLGRTGCKVSRLCLGTMNFGPRTSEPDSHAILSAALDLGINFWDTADVYGNKGGTETILGRWFEANRPRRDQVVIATKYQGSMGDGPNDRGASAFHIRQACEASLKRMKIDCIDLYQMHHVNRDTPWEEVYEALDVLRKQGKIIYAGTSNHAGWHIALAVETAKRLGHLGIVCEQAKYSLACRHAELEVFPACRYYGVGIIAWSPLDGGLLGGTLDGVDEKARRAGEGNVKKIAAKKEQLERWHKLCADLGEKPADLALAFTLATPGMTAPIIGPRTIDQLNTSLRALDIKITPEIMDKLDEVWPSARHPDVGFTSKSPYKYESPEAFAW